MGDISTGQWSKPTVVVNWGPLHTGAVSRTEFSWDTSVLDSGQSLQQWSTGVHSIQELCHGLGSHGRYQYWTVVKAYSSGQLVSTPYRSCVMAWVLMGDISTGQWSKPTVVVNWGPLHTGAVSRPGFSWETSALDSGQSLVVVNEGPFHTGAVSRSGFSWETSALDSGQSLQ